MGGGGGVLRDIVRCLRRLSERLINNTDPFPLQMYETVIETCCVSKALLLWFLVSFKSWKKEDRGVF